jgi:hypothetical protein
MVRSLGILSTVGNQDYEVAGYNNRAEDNRVSRPVYQNACPPRAEGHMTSRPKLKQLSQGEGTEGNTASRFATSLRCHTVAKEQVHYTG